MNNELKQGTVVILTTDDPHYGVVEKTEEGWAYVWFPHMNQVIECRASELVRSGALGHPNYDKEGRITEAGRLDYEKNSDVFLAWRDKRLIPDKVDLSHLN